MMIHSYPSNKVIIYVKKKKKKECKEFEDSKLKVEIG